mmetsp:Transcript_11109/g.34421  ORF Transcript_11109/g.34421 Transcript_11109/m.34421 type:complete len:97 (-) Transcript_11109:77-367(-)
MTIQACGWLPGLHCECACAWHQPARAWEQQERTEARSAHPSRAAGRLTCTEAQGCIRDNRRYIPSNWLVQVLEGLQTPEVESNACKHGAYRRMLHF